MPCAQDIQELRKICTDELRVFIPATFFIGTNREKIDKEIFARNILNVLTEAIEYTGTSHEDYNWGMFWK